MRPAVVVRQTCIQRLSRVDFSDVPSLLSPEQPEHLEQFSRVKPTTRLS